MLTEDWKPGPDDGPHELPHWAAVEATCGHVVEFRCAKPLEPKVLIPQANDQCGWCDADEAGVPKAEQPNEIRNSHFGGILVRRCPLTIEEIRALNTIEERVKKDGPDQPDTGRRSSAP